MPEKYYYRTKYVKAIKATRLTANSKYGLRVPESYKYVYVVRDIQNGGAYWENIQNFHVYYRKISMVDAGVLEMIQARYLVCDDMVDAMLNTAKEELKQYAKKNNLDEKDWNVKLVSFLDKYFKYRKERK